MSDLSRLRDAYPMPDTAGIEAYDFALIPPQSGHELVTELIRENDVQVMLEIGVFLGGSVRRWLSECPDLIVVGVDPWYVTSWTPHLERYLEGHRGLFTMPDPQAFIASVAKHGNYLSAMANLREFGDRFIPVKALSPDVLPDLKALGLEPDLVYIDAGKVRDDLDGAHALWPNAILCGDDWNWGADKGYPLQQVVNAFARDNSMIVDARRVAWALRPED